MGTDLVRHKLLISDIGVNVYWFMEPGFPVPNINSRLNFSAFDHYYFY